MIIRDIIFSTNPPATPYVLWVKAGANNVNTLYIYDGGWRKIGTSSGEGGTSDYTELENKPKINNIVLEGNLSLEDLGIVIPSLENYVTREALNTALSNYALKSELPDITNLATKTEVTEAISNQQFKTVNGQVITGEGNIEIQGGSTVIVDNALNAESVNPVQNKVITEKINTMSELLAQLDEKVFPTTLSVSGGGIYDEGTSQTIMVSWKLQKNGQTLTPESVTVNGESVDPATGYKVFVDVTSTTTYSVSVVYKGKTYSGSTAATFKKTYYRYYGAVPVDVAYGDVTLDMVKALKKEVCTGASATLQFPITADGGRMVNAYPKAFGELSQIKDGGLNAPLDNWGIEKSMTIDGEEYYVYASKEVNYEDTFTIIFVK